MQNPKENPKQAGRGCFYAIEQEAKKKKQKKAGRNQHLSRFCAIRKKAARVAPLNHPPAQRMHQTNYERVMIRKAIKTRPEALKEAIGGCLERGMRTTDIYPFLFFFAFIFYLVFYIF